LFKNNFAISRVNCPKYLINDPTKIQIVLLFKIINIFFGSSCNLALIYVK